MKKIKFIYLLLACGVILTACGSEENKKDDKNKVEENKTEEKKEVETTYSFARDSSIIVQATNPINEIIDLEITVQYYDEKDELISEVNATCVSVHKLSTAYSQFKDVPDEAVSFVVTADYEISDVVESYSNILDVLTADNGHNINVSINNYNKYSIANTSIGVIFYDNNEIVAYNEYPITNITANEVRELVANYPVDVNGGTIYFDSVSTVVNYAYNPVN